MNTFLEAVPLVFRGPASLLGPFSGTLSNHDALRMTFSFLPDKGPRELQLTLEDGRVGTFAVGHLERISVRESLLASSLFHAEIQRLVRKAGGGQRADYCIPRDAASM